MIWDLARVVYWCRRWGVDAALTDVPQEAIHHLVHEKYATTEWNRNF